MSPRPAIALDPAAYVRASARVAEVAELLACDESEVRRMVRDGELRAHRKGIRGIRVYLDSVTAYQEAREIHPQGKKPRLRAQRATISRAADLNADAALRAAGILR